MALNGAARYPPPGISIWSCRSRRSLLPVDAATGVTLATSFSWTPAPAETVTRVRFDIGDWTIFRYTTESSTTIPDLSTYGLALPAATAGAWSIITRGPATTMDEVLVWEDRYWRTDMVLSDRIATSSDSRPFTTQ